MDMEKHWFVKFCMATTLKIVKFKYQERQMIQAQLIISFIGTVKICILYHDQAVKLIGSMFPY